MHRILYASDVSIINREVTHSLGPSWVLPITKNLAAAPAGSTAAVTSESREVLPVDADYESDEEGERDQPDVLPYAQNNVVYADAGQCCHRGRAARR
jgi:hypothetical protein